MGGAFSKSPYAVGPESFAATPSSDDPAQWKQYYYVIIGGGKPAFPISATNGPSYRL